MAATTFQTSLNYLSSTNLYDKEKPYEIWLDEVPAGLRPTNVAFQLYPDVAVHDARAVGLDSFSIEEHGFEFRRHPFPKDRCPISTAEDAIPTNEQRDAILSYIDVMNKFLRESLGGEKAVCFDWRVGGRFLSICLGCYEALTIAPPRSASPRALRSARLPTCTPSMKMSMRGR
jgi:hypothetical protein